MAATGDLFSVVVGYSTQKFVFTRPANQSLNALRDWWFYSLKWQMARTEISSGQLIQIYDLTFALFSKPVKTHSFETGMPVYVFTCSIRGSKSYNISDVATMMASPQSVITRTRILSRGSFLSSIFMDQSPRVWSTQSLWQWDDVLSCQRFLYLLIQEESRGGEHLHLFLHWNQSVRAWHLSQPHFTMECWDGEDSISVQWRRASREGRCAGAKTFCFFVGI